MYIKLLNKLFKRKVNEFYFLPPLKKMIAINSDVEFTSWETQVDLLKLFQKYEKGKGHKRI